MAKIKGQLEDAQLHNKATDPSNTPDGLIWLNTATSKVKTVIGAVIKTLVTEDGTQTLTNKTLTSPSITTPTGIVKGDVGLGSVDNTSDATKNSASVALTNKTIDADSNTITNIENADIKASAAIALNKLAATTASRAIVSDGSGFISASTTTAAQVGYLSNTTGDVQTSLDAKVAKSTLTTKGDIFVASGASTPIRRAIGTAGQVLTVDLAETDGVKWAVPTGSPASNEISNLSLACSVASSALTIELKDQAGSNPNTSSQVRVGFRSATSATGTFSSVTVSSALDLVVVSGATLGHASGRTFYPYVYLINNAGSAELAISTAWFDDGSIVSTTAMSSSADSNAVMYSTTARSNVACRMIGRLTTNQVTAGTWALVPTEISLQPFERIHPSASFRTDAGQSVANANYTVVDYEDRRYDRHNNVTVGGSWAFLANESGIYDVAASIRWGASTAVDNRVIAIYVNGSSVYEIDQAKPTASSIAWQQVISGKVELAVGDTIQIYCRQASGGALALTNTAIYNWVSIAKVGKS